MKWLLDLIRSLRGRRDFTGDPYISILHAHAYLRHNAFNTASYRERGCLVLEGQQEALEILENARKKIIADERMYGLSVY